MIHTFTVKNIETIAKILDTDAKPLGEDVFRLELKHTESDRKISIRNPSWSRCSGRFNEYGFGVCK